MIRVERKHSRSASGDGKHGSNSRAVLAEYARDQAEVEQGIRELSKALSGRGPS